MKNKYQMMILGAIVLAAIVLRFNSVLEQRDFWYDEAFTGIILKQDFSEMNQSIFNDVHPPLYYWLVKPWAAIGDYTPFAIRSFSAFLGVLTVVSLFWIGKKMFNERVGLLAAAIGAISPFAIEYSQEARMYSLFGFLMLWAVWFFYRAVKKGEIKDWIGWGIFCGLSFYTHYLSLFFFVMFYVACVITAEKSKGWIKKLLPAKGFLLGSGIILIFFLSWIKIFVDHISKGNLGWIEPSYLSAIPQTLQIFFFGHPAGTGGIPSSNGFKYFFDGSSAGILILVLLAILLAVIWKKTVYKNEFKILAVLSLGTLIFLIILSHFNIKLYVARYFMPAALLLYLFLSALAAGSFAGKKWKWIIILLIYGLFIFNLKPLDYNGGWSQIYRNQNDLLGCCSFIVTSNPFEYSTAKYYFGENRVRFYNRGNPTEDFSGWVVVGNKNRLDDLDELKSLENFVIIDRSCDWEELKLKSKGDYDGFSICTTE